MVDPIWAAASPQPAGGPSDLSHASLSRPDGAHQAQEDQVEAWLVEHCGRGLPYADATDLPSALHGLAYILRQIEGTNSYKVFIGQTGPASSSLRWVLHYLARQELSTPPKEVVALVVAARRAVEANDWASQDRRERICALDRAAEAFARRVPWDDEPCDSDGSGEADETGTGSAVGDSAGRNGIAEDHPIARLNLFDNSKVQP